MTLCIGDHVIKLGRDGQPVRHQDEAYIEFEVVDLSPTYEEQTREGDATVEGRRYQVVQFAKLRKVR